MSWQQFDLVFQLLSPLHVGWRKVSNLQQTRGYLPGKNIWAALTARLTRETGQGKSSQAYQVVGELVQEHFRFTYFYPALQNGCEYQVHYPWEDGFDYLFLDSYASAALDYPSQSATDGLLHETEFIAPQTRTGQPVYLTGNLYVKDKLPAEVKIWPDALQKLQFGGERGYGWGRVKLVSCNRKEGMASDEVQVEVTANGRITAHLKTENTTGVIGPIEPVVGWERNNAPSQSRNWRLSPATICYAPGAKVTQSATFMVGQFGLWTQITS